MTGDNMNLKVDINSYPINLFMYFLALSLTPFIFQYFSAIMIEGKLKKYDFARFSGKGRHALHYLERKFFSRSLRVRARVVATPHIKYAFTQCNNT